MKEILGAEARGGIDNLDVFAQQPRLSSDPRIQAPFMHADGELWAAFAS